MKRGLLLGVLLALFYVSFAGASTTISTESDPSRPWARWIEKSRMPSPNLTLTVVGTHCPDGGYNGCTYPGTTTIYVARGGGHRAVRMIFLHELGHQFDYALPAGSHPYDRETFAEIYRQCAMGGWAKRNPDEGSVLTRGRMHKACDLIRSLG